MMKIITYVNDPFFAIGQSSRLYYMHTVMYISGKNKGDIFQISIPDWRISLGSMYYGIYFKCVLHFIVVQLIPLLRGYMIKY